MKRVIKNKKNKIRCCICIDEDLFIESGEFIDNLSGFFNQTLRNYIEYKKSLEKGKNDEISDNIYYVQKNRTKKCSNHKSNWNISPSRTKVIHDEPIDEQYKWW